ncbi:outer spore coat protein CotE [Tepidibacter formicigenes]|jgi:hypothetical protein|uniref:Outer spore coat protein E (CotE) n=1 Tax=Tepidibacter formicigenes DSM 15518 TaxID=1123349 RepID=A0A1M6N0X1_9FIRM|nr:outer spore coat protein CotE [Tepidibacter formicigenes]SHJ89266.1 Outer spore coat protein E (CotE) [Tepidibacter formicigenes DSM 15518]
MDNKYKNNRKISTIITNTVCGRKSQTCKNSIYLDIDDIGIPTQILGCAIRNAKIEESKIEEISKNYIKINVRGEFEVHVWYEENDNTNVVKSYEKFSEIISIPVLEGEEYYSKKVLSRISKQPTSLGSMIINKSGIPTISIQIEYTLDVEIIGEARLNVLCYIDREKEDKNKKLDFSFDDDEYDDD